MNGNSKNINIDLLKESFNSKAFITRQGENGQQYDIRISENGNYIAPTTAFTVTLKGVNAKNQFVEVSTNTLTSTGQRMKLIVTKDWNAVAGAFKLAYIEVKKGAELLTSINLQWNVLEEATVTDNDKAHYIDELQQIIDQLQAEADATLQEINDKLSDANANIDTLENQLAQINTDIQNAIEQFENGDFYSKTEADDKFVKYTDVATTGKKGIVQLNNNTTSSLETTAATSKAVSDVSSQIQAHSNRRDNPHVVTAAQVGAVPRTGDSTIEGQKTFTIQPKVGSTKLELVQDYSEKTFTSELIGSVYKSGKVSVVRMGDTITMILEAAWNTKSWGATKVWNIPAEYQPAVAQLSFTGIHATTSKCGVFRITNHSEFNVMSIDVAEGMFISVSYPARYKLYNLPE